MSTHLFLLGCDHIFQCGGRNCSPEQANAFAAQVRSICCNHNIRRIAEEMDKDGRAHYGVEDTIARVVARELSVHHQEIDLSKCERNAISLTDCAVLSAMQAFRPKDGGGKLRRKFDAMSDQVRERIWAARIMHNKQWPVLFILGADHITTFLRVWQGLGGEAKVVHHNFVP